MRQTIEAFIDTAVAHDHNLLSDRAIKFVAAALSAQVALGAGALGEMYAHTDNIESVNHLLNTAVTTEHYPSLVDNRQTLLQPLNAGKTHQQSAAPTPTSTSPIRPINSVHRKEIVLPPATPLQSSTNRRLMTSVVAPEKYTDESWPQCLNERSGNEDNVISNPVAPDVAKALGGQAFMILGVNGGRPMTSNNCLKSLSALTKNYDYYLNSANPGLAEMKRYLPASGYHCKLQDRGCIAEAYGYLSANYAAQMIEKAGLHAPQKYFWIDVEHPNPWKGDGYENRAVIIGMIKALKDVSPTSKVGFYSVPKSIKHPKLIDMWDEFMGIDHKDKTIDPWLNGYDTWIATGAGSPEEAKAACASRKSFTNGTNVLSQYNIHIHQKGSPTRGIDGNIVCPKPVASNPFNKSRKAQ